MPFNLCRRQSTQISSQMTQRNADHLAARNQVILNIYPVIVPNNNNSIKQNNSNRLISYPGIVNWALREPNNICSYIMFFNSSQCQWISRVSHLSLELFSLLLRVARYINFTCRLLSGLFKSWYRLFRALFLCMVRSFEIIWFTTTLVCFLALSITILFLILL